MSDDPREDEPGLDLSPEVYAQLMAAGGPQAIPAGRLASLLAQSGYTLAVLRERDIVQVIEPS